jgi:hypothetical protein
MNKEQTGALAQLERALNQVATSGARLRGVQGELFVTGAGKRRSPACHRMETEGVYHDLGEAGRAVDEAEAPLWDFDAKQRRGILALEAALARCDQSDLCLLGSASGLLAVEREWLEKSETLEDLHEVMEMVQDGGAWER